MVVEPSHVLPVARLLLLKRISWLAGLSTTDLAAIGDHAQDRFWPRGSVLLRAGETVGAVHVLIEGRVRLRRRGRDLGCTAAGTVIGASLLLADDAEGLEAVAETDALTLAIDRESALDILDERFEIYRGALRETCRELVEIFVSSPGEAAPAPVALPAAPAHDLDLVERIVLVRSRPPFEACSINAIAELSLRLEEVPLPAGTVLWRRGDRAERMLFVASGSVRCEPAEQGFRVGPGQPLGTLELLGELPRWYDAEVEVAGTALGGAGEQLLDLFEDNVDMGITFLSYLTRGLIEQQERAAERAGSLAKLFECEDGDSA